jgi:hypothetical protein
MTMSCTATNQPAQSIPTPQEIEREYPQLAPLLPEPGEGWYAGHGNPVAHLLNRWEWHQSAILALFRKVLDDPSPDTAWGAYHSLHNHTQLMKVIREVAEKYPMQVASELSESECGETENVPQMELPVW